MVIPVVYVHLSVFSLMAADMGTQSWHSMLSWTVNQNAHCMPSNWHCCLLRHIAWQQDSNTQKAVAVPLTSCNTHLGVAPPSRVLRPADRAWKTDSCVLHWIHKVSCRGNQKVQCRIKKDSPSVEKHKQTRDVPKFLLEIWDAPMHLSQDQRYPVAHADEC